MIKVEMNQRQARVLHRLEPAELVELERRIAVIKIDRVVLRLRRQRPVPPKVWMPIADIIAGMHGLTRNAMLFGSDHCFIEYVPRARFWRVLRALQKNGKPRYSLLAIANITGHDHTSVMNGLKSRTADRDYSEIQIQTVLKEKRGTPAPPGLGTRRDLTGETFGTMTVSGAATTPAGKSGRWWTCSCTCGSTTVQSTKALSLGKGACGLKHRAPAHKVIHLTQPEARP